MSTNSSLGSRRIGVVYALAIFLAGGACLFERFFSATLLNFYDDDSFYYIKVAQHLVHDHRSTFDGIHLTNGYHPLWMLILVILVFVSSGKLFFVSLQTIAFLSLMSCFLLSRAIFRQLAGELIANLLATLIALQCLMLLRSGMEVILTLPLALLLCWYRLRSGFKWTVSSALLYGFLGSLVVLSRLDAIIFVVLLYCFDLIVDWPVSKRLRIIRVGTYLAFLIPLAAYLVSNHVYFGTWTTVSAQAKQLRWHHTPNFGPLYSLLVAFRLPYRLLISYPVIASVGFSLFSLSRRPSILGGSASKAVVLSLLFSPLLNLLALSILSDWALWTWYLYIWILAGVGSLLVFLCLYSKAMNEWGDSRKNWLTAGALTVTLIAATAESYGKQPNRWYLFARDVEMFSSTHHGLYAMGDCAGTTAYLIHDPLLQVEGLVMDEAYLENIREQRDLLDMLKSYHIRYYVTVSAVRTLNCYRFTEPIQAGSDSPHMQSVLCQQPAASFSHGRTTVNIFDLQKPQASGRLNP